MNRDAELFNVLKEGIRKEIIHYAEGQMEFDQEAQSALNMLNWLNRDVGGNMGYDDLPESITKRLEEQAKEELENDLQKVFQDGNDALIVLIKIIRGLV